MNSVGYYFDFPADLSGSRSKNRFRFELLWGLKKALELQMNDIDFTIIFDFYCDIEIHTQNKFEFYQIKSSNSNGSFTVDKLIQRNKTNESILGKVYKLKFDSTQQEKDNTLISVVCNAPLSEKSKSYNSHESIDLKQLTDFSVKKVKKELREELNLSQDINLDNTYYIRTSLDLINPNMTLIGELVQFFKNKFNSEPRRIHSLYKLIEGEIVAKACYELQIIDYENVLLKKGISSGFFSQILKEYAENDEEFLKRALEWVDSVYANSFLKRNKYKRALSTIIVDLQSNKQMQIFENKIKELIINCSSSLPGNDDEIISFIFNKIKPMFPIETSDEEIQMLVLLVIKKFDEGIYTL